MEVFECDDVPDEAQHDAVALCQRMLQMRRGFIALYKPGKMREALAGGRQHCIGQVLWEYHLTDDACTEQAQHHFAEPCGGNIERLRGFQRSG